MIRAKTFKECIEDKARDMGKSLREIYEAAGITSATFFRRVAYSGALTLDEFRRLDLVLHFTDEEKLMIIDRVMR